MRVEINKNIKQINQLKTIQKEIKKQKKKRGERNKIFNNIEQELMDNNSQQQNQIHQNLSYDQSSNQNDLSTGQQRQSEISNTDINLSMKTEEQTSFIEINTENQNTKSNAKLANPVKHNKIFKILIFFICFVVLGCVISHSIANEVIFSNINNQKIVGTRDSDEIGSNKMLTLVKRKNNKSYFHDLLRKVKQSNDNENLDNISEKQQSKINLKFDTILNKFVVIKENLVEKDLFEKEYKTLEKLKDTNVTLDLVSVIQNDYKFEQVAGKTNLYQLKQKMKDEYTFGLLYFKLFDKLNKMHEYGIAHSDIKPHHLVLSFDNDPFFIDFGVSISLSDEDQFQNYLNHFTPEFNLPVYFEIFNQKDNIYKTIQFSSKEQIKLCDMTQLSLTFLYLLCQNDYQLDLFYSKKYNELLEMLSDKQYKRYVTEQTFNNRMIILHNISRILNQADLKINVINEGKDQQFLNDEAYAQDVLDRSSDVLYKNNTYTVKYIDQFSILFIYYYDQQNYNLEIIPQNIFITILLSMQEYKIISEKYKFKEYFQDLINSKIELNEQTLFNIFQYEKIQDIKTLNIDFQFQHFVEFWHKLQNSKLKDTLEELNMKFYFSDHTLCQLSQALHQTPSFQIQNFKVSSKQKVSCRIIRVTGKNQIPDITLSIKQQISINKMFINDFKAIQNTYKIKEMDINLNTMSYREIQILSDLQDEIDKINKGQKYLLNIQFEHPFYKKEDNQIQQFLIKALQINETRQTVLIKFNNYDFNDILIWQQIKNIMESKNNFHIQIFIVNGRFNKQVSMMLQEIQLISDKVKYKFEDEYIEKNVQTKFCKEHLQKNETKLGFQDQLHYLNIQYCSQPQSEQILEIVFYKKITFYQEKWKIQEQKFLNSENKYMKSISSSNKRSETSKDLYEQKSVNQLKKLKIQYEQQIYVQSFKFKNRKVEIENNQKDIDLIINQIQNNNHYSEIKILNKSNKKFDFVFKDQKSIELEIFQDSQDIEKMSQIKQLNLAVSNTYDKTKQKELVWNLPIFYQQINLNQTIKYQSYSIKQKIQYQPYTWNTNNEKIFIFLAQNSTQLKQIKKKQNIFNFDDSLLDDLSYNETKHSQQKQEDDKVKFLLLSWTIELEDKTFFKNNQIDQIRDIFNNNKLKNNIDHFQEYSAINSLLPTQIFNNQLLLQIDFESQQINDNSFNILFEEIEKQLPQNKMYNLVDCGLTGLTIQNIFESVKTQQSGNKLYFDLTKNKISFTDFKQFINQVQLNDLIQSFIFQIQYNVLELKQDLADSSQDIQEIKESDFLFLSDLEKLSSSKTDDKRIQIKLEFSHYIDRQSLAECYQGNFFPHTNQYSDIRGLKYMRQFNLEKDKKNDENEHTGKINDDNSILNNKWIQNLITSDFFKDNDLLNENDQFNDDDLYADNPNSIEKSELLDMNSLKELIQPSLQQQ